MTDSEVESEEEDGLGSGGGSGGMFMDNIMGIEDLEPAQPVANGTHNVIEVKRYVSGESYLSFIQEIITLNRFCSLNNALDTYIALLML